jgi:hypothetical protein
MVMTGYPLPFGRTVSVRIIGDRFVFGDGSHFELRFYDRAGSLEQIVRVANPVIRVTDADRARVADASIRSLAARGRSADADAWRGLPSAPTVPAFGDILVDSRNRIWVQSYSYDEKAEQTWTLFAENGLLLGRVVTPPGLRVMDIGVDRIVGVSLHDSGSERVLVFGLSESR